MMIKNLYTYEYTKTFQINPLIKWNYSPVISNVVDNNSKLEGSLQPRILRWNKREQSIFRLSRTTLDSRAFVWILTKEVILTKINNYWTFHNNLNKEKHIKAVSKLKINYILRKIESYWSKGRDKCFIA